VKDKRKNPVEGLLQITYSKLTNLKLLCVGHWSFVRSPWEICKQSVKLECQVLPVKHWIMLHGGPMEMLTDD